MLTAQGFKRKRYDDFIVEMEEQARVLYGSDINLSANSPLGKFIQLIAFGRAEENEFAEAVYNSSYVDTAENINLDHVCKYIGITRIQAKKAIGSVRFTVDIGTTIPKDVIVETTDGVEFVTIESIADSDNNGIVDVKIEAINSGVSGNVPPNTITVINTPQAGVQSVTNPLETKGGREKETDRELRDRYYISVAKGGASTLDGIRATLLNDVAGARAAVVIENNTDTADAANRPPHSFEAIVLGGVANDIGKAILKTKPAGIKAHGSQTVSINDDSGNPQSIGFSWATEVQIYIKVTLTTDSSFPTDGQAMVELEVIKHIGGTDASGNIYAGLGMGDDVTHAKLINVVFGIQGVKDAVVEVSKDNVTFTTSNIAIAVTEVAQTDSAKVVIS